MRISESDLAFLAACISTDGCVAKRTSGGYSVEFVATVELDWAEIVKAVAERVGIATRIHGDKSCWHVVARSTVAAYIMLIPVSRYIMPRKWARLDEYFEGRLPWYEHQLEVYSEAITSVAAGESRYAVSKRLAEKYVMSRNSIQRWLYNDEKPRLVDLLEVQE